MSKRRHGRRNTAWTQRARARVRTRDGDDCWFCGKLMDFTIENKGASARATLEHKIDLALGGTNQMENLVLACGSCNSTSQGLSYEAKLRRRVRLRARTKRRNFVATSLQPWVKANSKRLAALGISVSNGLTFVDLWRSDVFASRATLFTPTDTLDIECHDAITGEPVFCLMSHARVEDTLERWVELLIEYGPDTRGNR